MHSTSPAKQREQLQGAEAKDFKDLNEPERPGLIKRTYNAVADAAEYIACETPVRDITPAIAGVAAGTAAGAVTSVTGPGAVAVAAGTGTAIAAGTEALMQQACGEELDVQKMAIQGGAALVGTVTLGAGNAAIASTTMGKAATVTTQYANASTSAVAATGIREYGMTGEVHATSLATAAVFGPAGKAVSQIGVTAIAKAGGASGVALVSSTVSVNAKDEN